MTQSTNRRAFIKTGVATARILAMPAIAQEKKNAIRMGFIGVGNRGTQLLHMFMDQPDVEVVALCDVYGPYMRRDDAAVSPRWRELLGDRIPNMGEKFSKPVTYYADYRDLLANKEIDAVCIATPDHWHAIQTIDAIQAGKDVYVEKPLTVTLAEGRRMVEAQKASKQVVAVGLNRRGSSVHHKLAALLHGGHLGELRVARSWRVNNLSSAGIGRFKDEAPPVDFDWDRWIGPRSFRPYRYNIAPYFFRWHSAFSTQMGNWGVHYLDAIRWMMQETAPSAIYATGGRYWIDHDADIPDTMEVIFEFASKRLVTFTLHDNNGGQVLPMKDIQICGEKGTVYVDENSYEIVPSRPGQFQTWKPSVEPAKYTEPSPMLADGSRAGPAVGLIRNFLDCIKTRQTPFCSLEEGHRSTSFAHLANIAVKMKQRLEWDPVRERFTNCEKANELLSYDYRKPYTLG